MRGDAPDRRRRRLVAVAIAVTLGLVVVDLVGGPGPGMLRGGRKSWPADARSTRLAQERGELRRDNERLADDCGSRGTRRAAPPPGALTSTSTAGARVVPRGVIGVATGPQGVVRPPRRRRREGVSVETVVVRRASREVASVASWTRDVLVAGVGGRRRCPRRPERELARSARGEQPVGLTGVSGDARRGRCGGEGRRGSTSAASGGRPLCPGSSWHRASVEPSRGRLAPSGTVRRPSTWVLSAWCDATEPANHRAPRHGGAT